jgi:hypothetical protein
LSIGYWIAFGFMVLDMGLNSHKGFYEYGKGKVCEDRAKIFVHYLKTQVGFDLLCVSMLVIPKVNQNGRLDFLLFIPIVFLWVKKFKYQDEIIKILQYKRAVRILFTLGTLFLDVLLQGHYGACIFTIIDLTLWS